MEVLTKPTEICSKCQCKFSYDKDDVFFENKQEWTGFFNGNGLDGGWKWRTYRYLNCPGCARKIYL